MLALWLAQAVLPCLGSMPRHAKGQGSPCFAGYTQSWLDPHFALLTAEAYSLTQKTRW